MFHNASLADIDAVYEQIDGVLFPGGDASLAPSTHLFRTASYIYTRAINDMKRGSQFTIFGHCMGFECARSCPVFCMCARA